MTTEQILKGVYAILQTLPAEDRQYAEKLIARHLKTNEDNGFTSIAIANLVIDLKDDLAQQEAKKGGRSAALKAVNSILKEASRSPRSFTLYNAPIIDGRQCICDGYRLVRLTEHLPLNVPANPTGYVDTDKLIQPAMFCDGYELELPTLPNCGHISRISRQGTPPPRRTFPFTDSVKTSPPLTRVSSLT